MEDLAGKREGQTQPKEEKGNRAQKVKDGPREEKGRRA